MAMPAAIDPDTPGHEPAAVAHRGTHANISYAPSLWYGSDPGYVVERLGGTSKVTRDCTAYLHNACADVGVRATGEVSGVRFRCPTMTYSVVLTADEWSHVQRLDWLEWLYAVVEPYLCCGARGRYRMRIKLPQDLNPVIADALLSVSQEKLDGSDGSKPVQTALRRNLQDLFNNKRVGFTDHGVYCRYAWLLCFLVAKIALGLAVTVDADKVYFGKDPDDDFEPELDDNAHFTWDSPPDADTREVVKERESIAEDKPLRDSIVVQEYPDRKYEDEHEKSGGSLKSIPVELHTAFTDEAGDESTTNVRISPFIFEPMPSFKRSKHNEEKGVSRHLTSGSRGEHSNAARERFNEAAELVKWQLLGSVGTRYYERVLPKVWATSVKNKVDEEDVKNLLSGFSKLGEIGLDETKLPRLIGSLKEPDAAATAYICSPVEQYVKEVFPGAFFSKGANSDEVDEKVADFLRRNPKTRVASCDFSKMDSSWTLYEKKIVLEIVHALAARLLTDYEKKMAERAMDPRIDGQKRIVWYLKFIKVIMDNLDAILFSGERGTSLFNRILVLILRTAEIIRMHGVDAALTMWQQFHDPVIADQWFDMGDGDDTAFDANGYKNEDEIVAAYREYNKYIEPVIAVGRLEVLSRYHHLTSKGKMYHMAKPIRNMDRLMLAILPRRDTGKLTNKEHALVATTAYQRCIACRDTLVVRQYARMVGDYHYLRSDKIARFDQDLSRLDVQLPSMEELRATARSVVHDEVSGFAMTSWVHFGGKRLDAKTFEQISLAWEKADAAMAELDIDDSHFEYPDELLRLCEISPCLYQFLGKSKASGSATGAPPAGADVPPLATSPGPASGTSERNAGNQGVVRDSTTVGESSQEGDHDSPGSTMAVEAVADNPLSGGDGATEPALATGF